jgi:hypothetical protein
MGRGEPLRFVPDSLIIADLDLFVRSERDYPYILPDPRTTSSHWVSTGFRLKSSGDYGATALASRGTWWLWDGTRFVDTGTRVTYDVWNHLQIAIDTPSRTYRVVAQPIGEMPTLVGTAKLGDSVVFLSDLDFFIQTSDTENHLSLYDNILVTSGAKP